MYVSFSGSSAEGLTKKLESTTHGHGEDEGSYVVLTWNTCIVGSRAASLVSRRRCTRSVYTRDFLDSPFEGVPFPARNLPRLFPDSRNRRSWNSRLGCRVIVHEWLCCFYGGT